ncbi:MAG: hypothetical protein JXA09_03105 [Anaerolineae bacterium]|nr:hypothetical protein [Anaerolineae bacterium]
MPGTAEHRTRVHRPAQRRHTVHSPVDESSLSNTAHALALSVQRAMAQPPRAAPADQLALQRWTGNRAVTAQIQAGRAGSALLSQAQEPLQAKRLAGDPSGKGNRQRAPDTGVLQRTDKPSVRWLSKKWWHTTKLEKAMKGDSLSGAQAAATRLQELDATYYKTLLAHLLEKYEGNTTAWKVGAATAPAAVRNPILYDLIVKPKAIVRWHPLLSQLSDELVVELAAHNPGDFTKNVLAVLHEAGDLTSLHAMIARVGMVTELEKDKKTWTKFAGKVAEPRAHPKEFIKDVLIDLRDKGQTEQLQHLLMVERLALTLDKGAQQEWLAFAETVLDWRWVTARTIGPALVAKLVQHAPRAFIEKVLAPLKDTGDLSALNNLYQLVTARGMVTALEGAGKTWTNFAKGMPVLKATQRVKATVKGMQSAPPVTIVDEIFKAFISKQDIQIGYYPASDLDAPSQIMLGEDPKERTKRLAKREQAMRAIGQQMPTEPSTQCDTIVKLLETMIKLYPGLDNVQTFPIVEPQALLTKPMASQKGGVIPTSFEGTVYDAKGVQTGRILFTGTSKEAPNSHTWLQVSAGGTQKPYDGVLGSMGDAELASSREPTAFKWNAKKKVWEDGNGNEIREVPKGSKKVQNRGLTPPNKLGFGTAYQIVRGSLSGS